MCGEKNVASECELAFQRGPLPVCVCVCVYVCVSTAAFIQTHVDISVCFAAWIVKTQNMSFHTEATWISK